MKSKRTPMEAGAVATAAILAVTASAAVINVQPGDSYAKIEAARGGDEVIVAPGTYNFLLHLTAVASASNPIVIHAKDPVHPPVWDFGATLLDIAPGSYHAGDRGRAAWQFSNASGYRVSGIVFRNCRNSAMNAAGIRYYYGSTNLWIGGCLFTENDNGLTGGTQASSITVENCEFSSNGNAAASSPTHNLYIYGGDFTLRYSYLHDAVQAQNFHVRAKTALIEANWIARAKSYEGDLMTDDDYVAGSGAFSQSMLLRGNVFVTGGTAQNTAQIVAIYNDAASGSPLTLSMRALYNTVVADGGHAAFVHVSNADGTAMSAEISDNIIAGTTRPVLIEDTAAAIVTGTHNWLQTTAIAGPLRQSVQITSPGFASLQTYVLAPGSPCIGAADPTVYGLPGREFVAGIAGPTGPAFPAWRPRAAARDLGAYESGSKGAVVVFGDPTPAPTLVATPSPGAVTLSWPLYAADAALEQSAHLDLPAWLGVAPISLQTNPASISTTIAGPAGHLFYRLVER
jgi:Right handed beta helix region